jgi:hypothetical protein
MLDIPGIGIGVRLAVGPEGGGSGIFGSGSGGFK